ncbi:hypothetical protein [Halobacterium litoreum]|uniref:Uncharacterized protein n=1 Tax=Halobacterium litoreum TaxID=2039234 RepID=A0ABD5NEI2_9EURY|nr:hypothetical protein [Halobacterium litoreum]UHH13521.1 hypothetical protein LT972_00660 [Halobacterium litoreum]
MNHDDDAPTVTDGEPDPDDPLSALSPSNTPSIPGSGRKWFAILVSLLLLSGGLYAFAMLLLSL